MKTIIATSCLLMISLISCKQTTEQNSNDQQTADTKSTIALIGEAHGYEQWDQVEQIEFAFNVSRGDYNSKRFWQWQPKTGAVTLIRDNDTINYNHKNVDSSFVQADAMFINDKYWLMAPFNLLWDTPEYASIQEHGLAADPISGDSINKLTITYKDSGGYTPGDAYDIFYKDDYTLSSWIYRKGNTDKPGLTTTWEDYDTFGPLKLAKMHQDSTKALNIYFTDLKVN